MRIWPLVLLSACSFPRASSDFTCTVTADCEAQGLGGRVCEQGFCIVGTETDAPNGPDGPQFTCTDWTPSPQHFEPCAIPLPTGPLVLDVAGDYTYDTATGTLTDPSLVTSRPTNMPVTSGLVISVSSFSVGTGVTLHVIGDVPLIVASWTTIEVTGAIDAGSTLTARGAGNGPADCANHAPTRGGNDGDGGGGSGGGGFRGAGGNGGDGDPSGGGNGNGGGLVAIAPLLLGGCAGVDGGQGDTTVGAGGAGGGAIQLTAQQSITISGSVNAGGQGGGGADGNGGNGGSGGGGGGSGGMIGIESPILTIADGAFVTANGGGGGQGGANSIGGSGGDGVAAIGRPAGGNLANGCNGIGGLGSGGVQVTGGVGGNDGEDGGGGGGGGAGFIVILSANSTVGTATISPPVP